MKRFLVISVLCISSTSWAQVWTDPQADDLPPSYAFQGEYASDLWGAHVIALNDKDLQLVLYTGGLPGAGWNRTDRSLYEGRSAGAFAVFTTAQGDRRYLGRSPAEFSATRNFPPEGQTTGDGFIRGDGLKLFLNQGETRLRLQRVHRQSPTIGMPPPAGALVLFDGSNQDEWQGGRLDAETKLLHTDGKDILTKRKFQNYRMHVEFRLPFRPQARGQGRGNSGFYHVDHYEMQILDSFGLEGLNNECGGIYQKADPLTNMCLPPLVWQTYDVEFHNATVIDGRKTKNAILTAKLNGIPIHEQLEIDGKTGGARNEPEGTPGPIKLQGHGNPLQFRNIWIEELAD